MHCRWRRITDSRRGGGGGRRHQSKATSYDAARQDGANQPLRGQDPHLTFPLGGWQRKLTWPQPFVEVPKTAGCLGYPAAKVGVRLYPGGIMPP